MERYINKHYTQSQIVLIIFVCKILKAVPFLIESTFFCDMEDACIYSQTCPNGHLCIVVTWS